MSFPRTLVAALLFAALLSLPPSAAAGTIETHTLQSDDVDEGSANWNGDDHPRQLRVNVLLPDGYDPERADGYPLLLLLHGAGGRWSDWQTRGEVEKILAGFDAITVMPDAATGFYMDWWNGGRRGDPAWSSYMLDGLLPWVERSYPIRPGRRWHAIAGLSMGGFGTMHLATLLPGYFGSAASMSGFLSPRRPLIEPAIPVVAGVEYEEIYGPPSGFYAAGNDPTFTIDNLRHTRLWASNGNGLPGEGEQEGFAGLVELELREHLREFIAAAKRIGASYTWRVHDGVHDWPSWRRDLAAIRAWNPFADVEDSPGRWTYRTVAQRGEAWGLRYGFAGPPASVQVFRRDGARLTGEGSGRLTLTNREGCSAEADLPFEINLPPSACGQRLRIGVRRSGRRRITLRVRISYTARDGRKIPLKGAKLTARGTRDFRRARTDSKGRATIRIRTRRSIRVRAASRGYKTARRTLHVRR